MMEIEPIVHVVDDDEAVRKTVRLLLQSVNIPVETYGNAREFMEAFDPARSGCIVLDVRMPGMSGMELHEKLVMDGVKTPVIVVTGHGDVPMAVKAVQRGALDFIEKPFREQILLDRIKQAIQKDLETRRGEARVAEIQQRLDTLTPREREVLELVVSGKNTKQIAAQFGVSVQAVAAHRERLMRKMGVESVAELVARILKSREG